MKTEEQIIELESRLAFQEHSLQELNEVVTQQQAQIDRLRATLEAFESRLNLLAAERSHGAGTAPEEEKPPHY